MRLAFQLAYKNLIGAGLRTWLNAMVLSIAFVIILFFNGLMDGWNDQARRDSIAWEYGFGQFWHEDYDPADPFTVQDGHGMRPADETLIPILIQQGSIYPDGRLLSISLKGIAADQSILELPTVKFTDSDAEIPVIIGKRMAKSANLEIGEQVLLRWRDQNGTYDAQQITVIDIFDTNVGMVDNGQLWLPIQKLWEMTGLKNHATMMIATKEQAMDIEGWIFNSQEELLIELTKLIDMKKTSSSFLYVIMLAIALLAIFDTQVLSIFRRQKEIGTYVSLGMTRWQVVGLFTLEGSMYSIFAMIVGCLYGIPLLAYLAFAGFGMPAAAENMGIAISDRIYPIYGVGLVLSTIMIVVISATIVSFLPARKIANMNPIDAIKGKIQ
ncbi:MAG: FtsX-like permease family protein [Reichenbachiella sp.]|uniref:ABC transporter permease n=1 Tax=Reichenbachiella sp. TaxID=2184521 RepID=UPI003298CEE6